MTGYFGRKRWVRQRGRDKTNGLDSGEVLPLWSLFDWTAMSLTFRIGFAVLLSCSIFSTAQNSTGSTDQNVSPPPRNRPTVKPAQTHPISQGPIDVLTDTRGVNFGPYLTQLLKSVREHWSRVIPESARAPIMKKGTVLIAFRIMKNGAIADLHYAQSSGDAALDGASRQGVASAAPFQPLPREFPCQYVALQFHFYYNPEKGDFDRIRQSSTDRQVLPCVTTSLRMMEGVEIVVSPSPAQVTGGASQQFSATIEGAGNSLVNWSVRGEGCAASDCGTVSATGLYTAPMRIPDPPRVTVTATLADDPGKSDSAAVAIVQANSSH
jgi:TonB family protein